jgi:hypothetical protein
MTAMPLAAPVMNAPMGPEDYANITAGYDVPADVDLTKFDHISVWAESITSCGSDATSPMQCFDIIFCVSCTASNGCCTTWKIVKRIAVDKCAMACQAETCSPVSVVEAVDPIKKERGEKITNRFKTLAGV